MFLISLFSIIKTGKCFFIIFFKAIITLNSLPFVSILIKSILNLGNLGLLILILIFSNFGGIKKSVLICFNKSSFFGNVYVDKYTCYAQNNSPDEIEFYVTKPNNKEVATYGNGTMISFLVDSTKAVNSFHTIALENGGVNEGLPGIRSDGNYYAYIRDPEGNKICAKCNFK